MSKELKTKAAFGLAWNMAEKVLTQGFSFVIGIVLARLLMPDDYGYVVVASTCISIFEAISQGGLDNALIQKQDTDREHESTMLYFSLGMASVFYLVLFFLAPLIAYIYELPELSLIIRVYAITLPVGALRSFLMAIMQKNLRFRLKFFSSLAGTIIAGVIGIWMAYTGWEIWALVAYMVIDMLIDTIVMLLLLRWKPVFVFSSKKLKELYSFGIYSLGWRLVCQYTNQFVDLIIGKVYSSADLSFFNRGKQYPYIISTMTNDAVNNTMFPVLSKLANDDEQLCSATRKFLKLSTYVQFPILMGFALVAKPLVILFLTEKWLPCVPFLQVTCLTYSFWPYLTSARSSMEAKGIAKESFKNEIIITFSRIILCTIAVFISPFAVAVAFAIVWFIDAINNGRSCQRIVGYRIIDQIKDAMPNYLCSIVMGLAVIGIGLFIDNIYLKLGAQIIVGIVSYILISIVIKNESFIYCLNFIKEKRNK